SSMVKHVPYGLQILLEGVSWAVMENKPDDIAEFFALYFQELVIFRKENTNEGLEAKASEHTDTLFSGEPKRKDKCTVTEEDQLLKEPEIQYSSEVTQHPSTASSVAESKSPPASARPLSPEGPELVYVPAESTQLAAHALGNTDSFCSVRDVATSVQTLYEDPQTSENEFTPVEGAAEDAAAAVPAAEPIVEAVRSQPAVQSPSPIAGQLGPPDSQADVSTGDVNQVSSATLGEDPSPSPLSPPPPPSPAPKDPLQAVPSCNEAEVTSATEAVTLWWDGE
ncbi:CABYR protein, partial [Phaetusa simplex]|nr:CABYR protein [Phaetusa simplex]